MAAFNHNLNSANIDGSPFVLDGFFPEHLADDLLFPEFRDDFDLTANAHRGPGREPDNTHYNPEVAPSFGLDASIKKRKTTHLHRNPDFVDLTVLEDSDQMSPVSSFAKSPVIPASDASTTAGDFGVSSYVLELFPNICPEYLEKLIATEQRYDTGGAWGQSATLKEAIIDRILENATYPRRRKKTASKEEDLENKKYLARPNLETEPFRGAFVRVLEREFPFIPQSHIRKVVGEEKTLYASYLELHKQEELTEESNRPYAMLKRKRPSLELAAFTHRPGLESLSDFTEELNAAKQKALRDSVAYHLNQDKERAEKLDEEEQFRAGNVVECLCCCAEVPLNKSIPCNSPDAHLFCFMCIRKFTETQIGYMRYGIQCMDTGGCDAQFTRSHLQSAIGSSLMAKLDSLQQEDEIQQAKLEGLESCPFCEYKAIYPPVEEDREFRCLNPKCEVISCRLCRAASHIPRTCDEVRQDRGLLQRHEVEEAMSEAFIRTCPRCKVKIVKSDGCNKMICSKCRCVMCYVCRMDITQVEYGHFEKPPNFCKTHDYSNSSRREVERAQKSTTEKILKEHPELTEEDVHVDYTTNSTKTKPLRPVYPIAHMYILDQHRRNPKVQPHQNIGGHVGHHHAILPFQMVPPMPTMPEIFEPKARPRPQIVPPAPTITPQPPVFPSANVGKRQGPIDRTPTQGPQRARAAPAPKMSEPTPQAENRAQSEFATNIQPHTPQHPNSFQNGFSYDDPYSDEPFAQFLPRGGPGLGQGPAINPGLDNTPYFLIPPYHDHTTPRTYIGQLPSKNPSTHNPMPRFLPAPLNPSPWLMSMTHPNTQRRFSAAPTSATGQGPRQTSNRKQPLTYSRFQPTGRHPLG